MQPRPWMLPVGEMSLFIIQTTSLVRPSLRRFRGLTFPGIDVDSRAFIKLRENCLLFHRQFKQRLIKGMIKFANTMIKDDPVGLIDVLEHADPDALTGRPPPIHTTNPIDPGLTPHRVGNSRICVLYASRVGARRCAAGLTPSSARRCPSQSRPANTMTKTNLSPGQTATKATGGAGKRRGRVGGPGPSRGALSRA